MKRAMTIFAAGLLAGAVLVAAVPGFSQDDPHAKYGRKAPTEAEQAAGMQRWQETMTLGKFHERLAYFVGDWTIATVMHWEGTSPEPAPGKATFRWIMEGRWLSQEMSGAMMGQPYRGFGITGYDNFKKQYVGCWIDSMGTAMLTFQGNIDRTGKLIEQYGQMDEPMLSQVGKTVKYVTRIVDDDHFVFEIHDLDIVGGEPKVMEITYTRVKK